VSRWQKIYFNIITVQNKTPPIALPSKVKKESVFMLQLIAGIKVVD